MLKRLPIEPTPKQRGLGRPEIGVRREWALCPVMEHWERTRTQAVRL